MQQKDCFLTLYKRAIAFGRGGEMEQYTELVNQARQGDTRAFSRLYESCCKDLYRFALYQLGQEEDAKDVVSETVLAAFENIGKLKSAEAFRPWIFRILVNKCKRKQKQYVFRTEELPETLHAKERDTCQEIDVRRAFASLSGEERMIVSMAVFAGYSSKEIGRILKKNSNTVRSKLSRSMGKMQKMLEG